MIGLRARRKIFVSHATFPNSYNCGNVSHFVAECPYEKREDNGGKLIRKDKAKSFPNKNNFVKKPHPKGMVALEEYPSNDDDDDDMVATTTVMGSNYHVYAKSKSSEQQEILQKM